MVIHCMEALQREQISKVSLIAFTENDIGNAFWKEIGWVERLDLNYYDFTLNRENIVRFNRERNDRKGVFTNGADQRRRDCRKRIFGGVM